MTDGQFRVLAILLAAIGLLLILVILFLLFEDGDQEAATPSPGATTATEPNPTSDATSTSSSATSSSTTSSSTTSSTTSSTSSTTTTSTTSTTTTTTTTTTTIPAFVLESDGVGGVKFGAQPDEAIAYVTGFLGPHKGDSGWVDAFSKYGTCPPPEVRGVEWGGAEGWFGFVLLFTKAATAHLPEGGEHFFSYYYLDGTDPEGLATADAIFIGSSMADLQATYGTDLEIFDDEIFGTTWFSERDFAAEHVLGGSMTGEEQDDFVETINGGVGCGE